MAQRRVYRVACIGAARMGSWFDDIQRERVRQGGDHPLEWIPGAIASVCAALDRVELIAVCDLKSELVEQMRARWNIPSGYTDFREMLARERPDIVAIVTSYGSTHAALAAAVAGGDGPPLVLAGRADARAGGLAAPGRVLLTGRVSDAELAALYSAADALVFPSDDEGFGLPTVEALACGTPVAAYAAGAVPEAVAGAVGVELVETGDLAGLLAAAERLSGSEAQPPPRDWADVARETWSVYERALSGVASDRRYA